MTRFSLTLASRLLLVFTMLVGGPAPCAGQTLASSATIQVSVWLQTDAPTGSLQTTILPAEAVANGAMWRLVGTNRPWRPSGYNEAGLDSLATYTVRFKDVLTPAPGWTAPDQFVTVNPDETTIIAGTYSGNICATLGPPEAVADGAKWRVVGQTGWLESGQVAKGLPAATYSIRFQDVVQSDSTWWTTPETLEVTTARPASISAEFFRTALRATILPAQAVSQGAKWRAVPPLPADPRAWRDSGYLETGLSTGTCLVRFNSLPGWKKPASEIVTIEVDRLATAFGLYDPGLTVNLAPSEAVLAGAKWRIALPLPPGPWRNSSDTVFLPVDDPCTTYTVLAKALPGWQTPTSLDLGLDRPTTLTLTYLKQFSVAFGTDGTPGAFIAGINPQTVVQGGTCTPVAARASGGYYFEKWTHANADYSCVNPLTVTAVAQNITLLGHFTPSSLIISDIVPAHCMTGILQVGARTYVDREFLFESPIPRNHEDSPYILTCNDDRLSPAGLRFRINVPATVTVAFDPRILPLPEWLSGWNRTDGTLLVGEEWRERILFERPFDAGLVALGPNVPETWQSSWVCGMYTVIVRQRSTTAVPAEHWNLYR